MKPEISVTLKKNGKYSVDILVVATNGCFSKGKYEEKTPDSFLTIPETYSITVNINNSESEFCTLSLVPVSFHLDDVDIGAGKSSITVFVNIHGVKTGSDVVVSSNSVMLNSGLVAMVR